MTGNNAALPCNKGEAVNSESKDEKITTKGKRTLIIFAFLYIIDWYIHFAIILNIIIFIMLLLR